MDALLSFRPTYLDGVPFSIQAIIAVVVAALVYTTYSLLTVERPLKGFPVVALSEQGLSSKWSWFHSSTETIAKGLKEHNEPFQVITGTGPKVCAYENFDFCAHSLTITRSSFQTALLMRSAPATSSTSPNQSRKICSPPILALMLLRTD
jgi:hypothetical protein